MKATATKRQQGKGWHCYLYHLATTGILLLLFLFTPTGSNRRGTSYFSSQCTFFVFINSLYNVVQRGAQLLLEDDVSS